MDCRNIVYEPRTAQVLGLPAEMFSPSCSTFSSVTSLCSIVLGSYKYSCTILGDTFNGFQTLRRTIFLVQVRDLEVCAIVVDTKLVSNHYEVLTLRGYTTQINAGISHFWLYMNTY